jgi:C4-dicarboxylate-specific signal transduction histidine kinase
MLVAAFDRFLASVGLCRFTRLTDARDAATRLAAAEQDALEAHARNRAILRAFPDLMFLQDNDGVYLDYYARDPKLLLLPPERFLGRSMREVLPPDLANAFQACLTRARESDDPIAHSYALQMGASTHHFEARIVKCDEHTLLSVVRDMTPQKDAEEQLHRAYRALSRQWHLMGLAELASSLARDVNQPLSAILANAQVALRWLKSDARQHDQIRSAVEDVIADAYRTAAVLQDAQSVFAPQPDQATPLSLNAIVRTAYSLMAAHLDGIRAVVRFELAEDLPLVLGRRGQLQHVMSHLLMNAADSLGALPVSASRTLNVTSRSCDGRVHVTVADTGIGIATPVLDQVFDPLYTTKRDGVGMGLTVSRSIIEAHGGTLWAEENAPTGTALQLSLPMQAQDEKG